MIAIVDSGVANLHSVCHALDFLGIPAQVAYVPADLEKADKIILPGVGAFEAGMAHLHARGFVQPLRDYAARGIPILGICLGMQLLFEHSDEMGDHEGLGLLEGNIVRFPSVGPKVPHVGWNQLRPHQESNLLKGINNGGYAYFVHSYYAQTAPSTSILASTDYGLDFPSVVGRDRVFGAQFHPEKSQHTGLTLLKNFAEMSF